MKIEGQHTADVVLRHSEPPELVITCTAPLDADCEPLDSKVDGTRSCRVTDAWKNLGWELLEVPVAHQGFVLATLDVTFLTVGNYVGDSEAEEWITLQLKKEDD